MRTWYRRANVRYWVFSVVIRTEWKESSTTSRATQGVAQRRSKEYGKGGAPTVALLWSFLWKGKRCHEGLASCTRTRILRTLILPSSPSAPSRTWPRRPGPDPPGIRRRPPFEGYLRWSAISYQLVARWAIQGSPWSSLSGDTSNDPPAYAGGFVSPSIYKFPNRLLLTVRKYLSLQAYYLKYWVMNV